MEELHLPTEPYFDTESVVSEQGMKCEQHAKKLEAFCSDCRHLVCIDCILGNSHRKHNIVSNSKALEVERDFLK